MCRPIAAIPDPATHPARDFLDYLTAWSTVLAAVLALAAILYTGWQAKKSADALVRERRLTEWRRTVWPLISITEPSAKSGN